MKLRFRPNSIRWRLLSWLGLLLVVLLTGFGVTAYQLNRRTELNQIDEVLARRVAALVAEVRGPLPSQDRPPLPRDSDQRQPGSPPSGPWDLPPEWSRDGAPIDSLPNDHFGPSRSADRHVQPLRSGKPIQSLSAATRALFDETSAELPYYVIWQREGGETKSQAAPADLGRPPLTDADSRTHLRTRDNWREAYYFTERATACSRACHSLPTTRPCAGSLAGCSWLAGSC